MACLATLHTVVMCVSAGIIIIYARAHSAGGCTFTHLDILHGSKPTGTPFRSWRLGGLHQERCVKSYGCWGQLPSMA